MFRVAKIYTFNQLRKSFKRFFEKKVISFVIFMYSEGRYLPIITFILTMRRSSISITSNV